MVGEHERPPEGVRRSDVADFVRGLFDLLRGHSREVAEDMARFDETYRAARERIDRGARQADRPPAGSCRPGRQHHSE